MLITGKLDLWSVAVYTCRNNYSVRIRRSFTTQMKTSINLALIFMRPPSVNEVDAGTLHSEDNFQKGKPFKRGTIRMERFISVIFNNQ